MIPNALRRSIKYVFSIVFIRSWFIRLLGLCGSKYSVDLLWRFYTKFKRGEALAVLSSWSQDRFDLFKESGCFSKDIDGVSRLLVDFHSGVSSDLVEDRHNFDKKNGSYKSILSNVIVGCKPVKEISKDEFQKISSSLSDDFDFILDSLNSLDKLEQLKLLEKINSVDFASGSLSQSLEIYGTLIFDACFIGVKIGKVKCFIVSLQAPLDGVFFPALSILVKRDLCPFSLAPRAEKLIKWAVSQGKEYKSFWEERVVPHEISHFIRDKRPYHVVCDEFGGSVFLRENYRDVPRVYLDRSSFIEDSNSEIVSHKELQKFSSNRVLFGLHHRYENATNESFFRDNVLSRANLSFEFRVNPKGLPALWVGIAGGEKRRWLEEKQGILAFIRFVQSEYGDCFFVFDGWTSPSKLSEVDHAQIESHKKLLREILDASGLTSDLYMSTIGYSVLRKVYVAQFADIFFACAGTPCLWPSYFNGMPGIVHNSTQMIHRVSITMQPDGIVKVPDDKITDINEVGNQIRWDRYSYSISVQDVEETISKAFSSGFGSGIDVSALRDFGKCYDILLELRKSACWSLLRFYESWLKSEFSNHRNLDHLLKSTRFFGAPSVAIMFDVPGAFRIIDCDTEISSDVAVVTFGKVSSSVDHVPFAYPFLNQNGFKHFHVAQQRKTSYQKLSLDQLRRTLGPVLKNFKYVFTYGSSLGGYAALYYANAIRANAIAASPRLPLHPINRKFFGRLWEGGSHWDETEFVHEELNKSGSNHGSHLVIFDPEDEIDSNFVIQEIYPAFSSVEYLHVNGCGHSALSHLNKLGSLQSTILNQIAKVSGS